MPNHTMCSVVGCPNGARTRGWCSTHYERWRTTGDVQADRPVRRKAAPGDIQAALWSQLDLASGCWIWIGPLTSTGYGHLMFRKQFWLAHRLAWTVTNGPIPDGMVIDHMCGNRACCNPDHLRCVIQAENAQNRMNLTTLNKSGHNGVHWDSKAEKWVASASNAGKTVFIGQFDLKESAVEAADKYRREHYSLARI